MGYIGFSSVSMLKALEATEQIGRYSADMQKELFGMGVRFAGGRGVVGGEMEVVLSSSHLCATLVQ